jgi:hypothetical protein
MHLIVRRKNKEKGKIVEEKSDLRNTKTEMWAIASHLETKRGR